MTAYRADRHPQLQRFEQHMALAAGLLDGVETRVRSLIDAGRVDDRDHTEAFTNAIVELDTARALASSVGGDVGAFERTRATLADPYAYAGGFAPLTVQARIAARVAYEELRRCLPSAVVPALQMHVQVASRFAAARRLRHGTRTGVTALVGFLVAVTFILIRAFALHR